MPLGPGKYDDVCTMAMMSTKAEAALVIIIGGDKGHGFSLQGTDITILRNLPAILEDVAQQIRRDGA